MKRIFEWLVSALEHRPITFTLVGGILSYGVAFIWLAVSFEMDVYASPIPFGIATLIIVSFHWFIVRYERRSLVAQLIALTPATLLVFTTMWISKLTVDHNICTRDSNTNEVECNWFNRD